MRRLTVSELLTATGGTLLAGGESAAVTSVSTDSRKAGEGALFIPLTGERFDGHDYIDKALALGAAGCLCARTPAAFLPDKFYIAVPDTRLALKALASWYRGQFNIPVVQITGSVGKTTTKEMIASVVSQRYRTLKTAENFNNDIGTPLTLLGLDDTYEAAVIETGMDHFGEIRYLGEMVRPHIAVITNIGDAHIEFLGSREGILKAKSEIFENLDADGVAIQKTPTVLEELVDTVLVRFQKLHPGVPVEVKLPDDFIVIPMDSMLIQQVLTNLLENAVLHAEGMTHLTLRVFTLGRRAVFEVIDNGCGIPKEQLKRLFSGTTLAQDTSSSGKHGMGIGLSVCAAIIKAHGGEIKAESTPGEGTTIRFWLETEEVDTEETEDEQ